MDASKAPKDPGADTPLVEDDDPRRVLTRQVGDRVQACRVKLGLSQEDVAYRSRTSRNTIGRVEAGELTMSIEILARIALALECHPGDLLPDDLSFFVRGATGSDSPSPLYLRESARKRGAGRPGKDRAAAIAADEADATTVIERRTSRNAQPDKAAPKRTAAEQRGKPAAKKGRTWRYWFSAPDQHGDTRTRREAA